MGNIIIPKPILKSIVKPRLTVLIKVADVPRFHMMECEGLGYDADEGTASIDVQRQAAETTIGTNVGST